MREAGSSSPSIATSVTSWLRSARPTATLSAAPPTNSREPCSSRSSSMSASPTTVTRLGDGNALVIRSTFPARRDLTGAALDQSGRHDRTCRGLVVAIEAGEDALGGRAPDALRVLRDDGDARVEEVGERHVVEADERGVRCRPSCRSARMTPIVTRFWLLKIAVGGVGESNSSRVATARGLLVVEALDHGHVARGDAGAAELLEEAPASFARGLDHGTVAEVGDTAVAAFEEVAGRERGAVGVVAHDGVRRDAARARGRRTPRAVPRRELGREVGLALGHRW